MWQKLHWWNRHEADDSKTAIEIEIRLPPKVGQEIMYVV
jgi:hypothetical protein